MKDIKSKLSLMYYGQKVFVDIPGNTQQIVTGLIIDNCRTDSYLALRSVEQLSDEELIKLSKQVNFPEDEHCKELGLQYIKKFINGYSKEYWDCHIYAIDYLRSIGIALPFTTIVDGAVRTVSVEEQIESGMVKLVEV